MPNSFKESKISDKTKSRPSPKRISLSSKTSCKSLTSKSKRSSVPPKPPVRCHCGSELLSILTKLCWSSNPKRSNSLKQSKNLNQLNQFWPKRKPPLKKSFQFWEISKINTRWQKKKKNNSREMLKSVSFNWTELKSWSKDLEAKRSHGGIKSSNGTAKSKQCWGIVSSVLVSSLTWEPSRSVTETILFQNGKSFWRALTSSRMLISHFKTSWPILLKSDSGQTKSNCQTMTSQSIMLSFWRIRADGLWWLILKSRQTTGSKSKSKRTNSKSSGQTSPPSNSKWSLKTQFSTVFRCFWKMLTKQSTVSLSQSCKKNLSSQEPLTEWSSVTKNFNTTATLDSTWQQSWENHITHLKSVSK